MVSAKIAQLSETDLIYLEKILVSEFAKQNEYKQQFKSKNGYDPANQTAAILRLLNAVRSQKEILTMPKW
jgi:uncharacterized protein YydD (DUF2326 family)